MDPFRKYLRPDNGETVRSLKKTNAEIVRRDASVGSLKRGNSRQRLGASKISEGPTGHSVYSNVGRRSDVGQRKSKKQREVLRAKREEGKQLGSLTQDQSLDEDQLFQQAEETVKNQFGLGQSIQTSQQSPKLRNSIMKEEVKQGSGASPKKNQPPFDYNTPRDNVMSSSQKQTPEKTDNEQINQNMQSSNQPSRGRMKRRSSSPDHLKKSKTKDFSSSHEKRNNALLNQLKPHPHVSTKAVYKKIDLVSDSPYKRQPSQPSSIKHQSSLRRFQSQFKRPRKGPSSLRRSNTVQSSGSKIDRNEWIRSFDIILQNKKEANQLSQGTALKRQSEKRNFIETGSYKSEKKPSQEFADASDELATLLAQPVQKSRVQVVARFRPKNEIELKIDEYNKKLQSKEQPPGIYWENTPSSAAPPALIQFPAAKTVQISDNFYTSSNNGYLTFSFDHIFRELSTQQEVYDCTSKRVVDDALKGYNSTIMAYGQTGSGKTYTMFGPNVLDEEVMGIIPRVSIDIFEAIRQGDDDAEFQVKIQMLEIYKEKFNDLLIWRPTYGLTQKVDHLDKIDTEGKDLKMKENAHRGTYIEGLTTLSVVSEDELIEVLQLGEQNRHVGHTNVNQHSSRSHSIFMIEIIQRYPNDAVKRGVINLVDLAGSERVSKSFAQGESLQEAKKINQSLSTLGKVINCISRKLGHIPYRDSKLTRLLKESLGGNNKTTLIVNCSVHSSQIEETLSTLRFAQSAKQIENHVRINMRLTRENQHHYLANVIKSLKHELNATKMELSRLANLRGVGPLDETQTNKATTFDLGVVANESSENLRISPNDQQKQLFYKLEISEANFKIKNLNSKIQLLKDENSSLKLANKDLNAEIKSLKLKCQEYKHKANRISEEGLTTEHLEFQNNEQKAMIKDLQERLEMYKQAEREMRIESEQRFLELHGYVQKINEQNWVQISKFPKVKARVAQSQALRNLFLTKADNLDDLEKQVSVPIGSFLEVQRDLDKLSLFLQEGGQKNLTKSQFEKVVFLNQIVKLSLVNSNFQRENSLNDLKIKQRDSEIQMLKKHIEELNIFRKGQRKVLSGLLGLKNNQQFVKEAFDKLDAFCSAMDLESASGGVLTPGLPRESRPLRKNRAMFIRTAKRFEAESYDLQSPLNHPEGLPQSKVVKSFSRREARRYKQKSSEEKESQEDKLINIHTFGKKFAQNQDRPKPDEDDVEFIFDENDASDNSQLRNRHFEEVKLGDQSHSLSNFDFESKITKHQNSKSGNSLLLSNYLILNEMSQKPCSNFNESLKGSEQPSPQSKIEMKIDLQPIAQDVLTDARSRQKPVHLDLPAHSQPKSQSCRSLKTHIIDLRSCLSDLKSQQTTQIAKLRQQNEFLETLVQQIQFQLVYHQAEQQKSQDQKFSNLVRAAEHNFYRDLESLKKWVQNYAKEIKDKVIISVQTIGEASKKPAGSSAKKKGKSVKPKSKGLLTTALQDQRPKVKNSVHNNYNQYNLYKQHYYSKVSSGSTDHIRAKRDTPIDVINQSLVMKNKLKTDNSLDYSNAEEMKVDSMKDRKLKSEYFITSMTAQATDSPKLLVKGENTRKDFATTQGNRRRDLKGRSYSSSNQKQKREDSHNSSSVSSSNLSQDESRILFGTKTSSVAQAPYFLKSNVTRRSSSFKGKRE